MRHMKRGKKFHRKSGQRVAFLRGLTNELIARGRIETTTQRAKAIRPIVERLVTIAKHESVAKRRLLLQKVHNKQIVQKLLDELGTRYKDRTGGYLRITKLSRARKRDGTDLATIEFV